MTELGAFLKERETGLCIDKYGYDETVISFVYVKFEDMPSFIKIVGDSTFHFKPSKCFYSATHMRVELAEFLNSDGEVLSEYEEYFKPSEWAKYKDKIIYMEENY